LIVDPPLWLYWGFLLSYALSELQKDVESELQLLPENERQAARTEFAVFVVHNKAKEKLAQLPPGIA
jgi:hypoxanthine phosphoribosyltransferase